MTLSASELWAFLPQGYLLTVLIEIPVLLFGLSSGHPFQRRLIAGFWLTACTYPIVILVLPFSIPVQWGGWAYPVTAEFFAAIAECLLFRTAYPRSTSRGTAWRDMAAIIVANVASFTIGLWIYGAPV